MMGGEDAPADEMTDPVDDTAGVSEEVTGETAADTPRSIDELLDAALSEDTLGALADKQVAEQVKKAVGVFTQQAAAQMFTAQQAQRLQERAQAAVFDRFGFSPEEAEEEPEAEPVSPEEFTAAFLEWMGWLIPLIEAAETAEREYTWCPNWWEHSEALDRLRALWLAHQQAYASDDRRGPSSWWVDHWDRHTQILLSPRGPFRHCRTGSHNAVDSAESGLVYAPPPETFLIAVC